MYYWCIGIEIMVNSTTAITIIHFWKKIFSNIYFLYKAHRSLLVLRNTSQHSSTILNNEIIKKKKKKHKNAKKKNPKTKTMHMVLKISQKSHLSIVVSWKQKDRPLPCTSSDGTMYAKWLKFFAILYMFVSDHESIINITFELQIKYSK